MGRLQTESEVSELAFRLGRQLQSIRADRSTSAFADLFVDPGANAEIRSAVENVLPAPDLLSSVLSQVRSEADQVALIMTGWPSADRPEPIQTLLFEALFVLWRFGSPAAGLAAITQGRQLEGSVAYDQGRLHIRLATLLEPVDLDAARQAIAVARTLGAPIPKAVEHFAGLAAPRSASPPVNPQVRCMTLDPPVRRAYPAPDGDAWHPAFDLAARDVPALTGYVIEGGYLSVQISGHAYVHYVFDRDRQLVPELSTGTTPFLNTPVEHHQSLVLLDDWHAGFNICHVLFDKYTRLSAYRELLPGKPLTAVIYGDHPFHKETLAGLGVGVTFPTSEPWTVRADSLALLSNHARGAVVHPAFGGADHSVRFVRENLQAPALGHRRLYISREDAAIRRNLNEEQVTACFERHGFEVCTLASLSFADQRKLIASASHIAGLHGAGLANMAFAGPGVSVMEMMPSTNGSFAYWVMASALGYRYRLLTVDDAWLDTGPSASFDLTLNFRDCRVDIDRLDAALAAFVAEA